jgi:hypothetical protein
MGNKVFKTPIVSSWVSVKKKLPKDQERVLVYCPEYTNEENPLWAFQFGTYIKSLNQWRIIGSPNTWKVEYWAKLDINVTSIPVEDQKTMSMFNMLGVKIKGVK